MNPRRDDIEGGQQQIDAEALGESVFDDDMWTAYANELEHHHKRPGIDASKFDPDATEGVKP